MDKQMDKPIRKQMEEILMKIPLSILITCLFSIQKLTYKKYNHTEKSLNKTLKELGIDNGLRFYFRFNSKKAKPGLGANELNISKQKINIPLDFRQILSNFYYAPFNLDLNGVIYRWSTVEHYFQASKLSLVNKNIVKDFSRGGKHDSNNGELARKQRKLHKLDGDLLKKWNKMSSNILKIAIFAKFSQNPEIMQVLCNTKNSHLIHTGGREAGHGLNKKGKFIDRTQWELQEVRSFLCKTETT